MSQKQTCANPSPWVAPATPPIANLAPVNYPIVEPSAPSKYFRKDQNLRTLLKSLQPKTFTREGNDVPKVLEECIMSMEDYFALAKYNALAQEIMGRAKLDVLVKL